MNDTKQCGRRNRAGGGRQGRRQLYQSLDTAHLLLFFRRCCFFRCLFGSYRCFPSVWDVLFLTYAKGLELSFLFLQLFFGLFFTFVRIFSRRIEGEKKTIHFLSISLVCLVLSLFHYFLHSFSGNSSRKGRFFGFYWRFHHFSFLTYSRGLKGSYFLFHFLVSRLPIF